jgi:predicted kinase
MKNKSEQITPITILVTGLPGSGKSYFARHLSQNLGAKYLSTDQIRNELIDTKTYSSEEKELVYREMKRRMLAALNRHDDVVLDGTFYREVLRQIFIQAAGKVATVFIIQVTADEELILERVNRDRPDSDADFAVYEKLKKEWQEIKTPHLTLVSTNDNLNTMLETAIRYIQS